MAAAIEWFTTMACREATLWVLETIQGHDASTRVWV